MIATVIIPAYNRENTIDRAIGSVANSGLITNHGAWEIIVVDDASTDGTLQHVAKWTAKYPQNIICLKLKDHGERVRAFNSGLNYARGDWIIRLDSDDELATHFKQALEGAINRYQTDYLFTWSSLVHHRDSDGTYLRTDVRHPGQLIIGTDGRVEPFRSGVICAGGFAFKRKLINKTGLMPEASNCYDFGKNVKRLYSEIADLYGDKDDLGNPWGDDYVLYYMLTRLVMPRQLPQILHIQHVR